MNGASVWVVAAIGLAIGGGFYVTGALATGITLLILAGLKPLERRVVRRRAGTTGARLGLELDAALLPVRDVISTVQDVGLPALKLDGRVDVIDDVADASRHASPPHRQICGTLMAGREEVPRLGRRGYGSFLEFDRGTVRPGARYECDSA